MKRIEAKNISYHRGEKCIISERDITINEGEIILIAGPSGVGKTTLLKLLSGILAPSSGSISYHSVSGDRMLDFGYHFVDGPFLEDLSLEANLLSLELFSGVKISRERLSFLLEYFALAKFLPKPLSTLSSGQRERASLIRAFLHNPKLVFLDEPGANLDDKMKKKMFDFLETEKKKKTTLVISSHDVYWLDRADRNFVLIQHED